MDKMDRRRREAVVKEMLEHVIQAIQDDPGITKEKARHLMLAARIQGGAFLEGGVKAFDAAYAHRFTQAFRGRFGGRSSAGEGKGPRPPVPPDTKPPVHKVVSLAQFKKARAANAHKGPLKTLRMEARVLVTTILRDPKLKKADAVKLKSDMRVRWWQEAPDLLGVFDSELAPLFDQAIAERFGPGKAH